ncbi:MAG: cysteine hydrolase [Bacteroidota bacterium]
MHIDPDETAVVLIEYQNDFVSEGGALHDAVKGVMAQTDMLDNTRQFVKAARDTGATIIHTPIQFAEGYPELPEHPYGILKGVVDTSAFRAGTWGAEIVDGLQEEGDVVASGKVGLDAFASTNLDFILRSRGVKNVVLGGFLTNCCVESTMRSAYERGFNVVTLTDCTAATSEEEQRVATEKDYPMFSHPMTSGEALDALSGGEAESASRGYAEA